ncbi:Clp protease N-terminal domain-containing protein [Streptomyces sp. NBC_01383]|uniref:Clp protease N-terminal domain-containing protein n=1 Tax=Streptomyces sp. NBC_01383 TaxID=2903846 RepID=UPI00386AF2FF
MFERFTKGARATVTGAVAHAERADAGAVGEEHVLLALTANPGVVADVLAEHGATYETVSRAMYGDGGAEQDRKAG